MKATLNVLYVIENLVTEGGQCSTGRSACTVRYIELNITISLQLL
jgi:hypothetical protein